MDWKFIDDYGEDYMISNTGILVSFKKDKPKVLSGTLDTYGYRRMTLSNSKGVKKKLLHRIVLESFIYNPENKPCVNHKDGNKLNNKVANLEWCTVSENNNHAFKTGLKKGIPGEDNCKSKLSNSEVCQIRCMWENRKILSKECGYKVTQKVISNYFNCSRSHIGGIVSGSQRTKYVL